MVQRKIQQNTSNSGPILTRTEISHIKIGKLYEQITNSQFFSVGEGSEVDVKSEFSSFPCPSSLHIGVKGLINSYSHYFQSFEQCGTYIQICDKIALLGTWSVEWPRLWRITINSKHNRPFNLHSEK